jgi:hypothetical protein
MGIDDFNVQSHEVILPYAVLEVVLQTDAGKMRFDAIC